MPLPKMLTGFIKLSIPVVFILFSSCHGASKTFSNADKWLPRDFKPGSFTLLIDSAGIKTNQLKKMEAHLQKVYHYPYQFVSAKNLDKDASYSDLNKYRFVLVLTYYYMTINLSSGSSSQIVYDFYFNDRLNKKEYPNPKRGSSWPSPTFNAIINTILKETK